MLLVELGRQRLGIMVETVRKKTAYCSILLVGVYEQGSGDR